MSETLETNQQDEIVTLLSVNFDHINNMYSVNLAKGSNVAETAFAMTIVIKCLLKDGVITKTTDITDLISKYLHDPQYEELKEQSEE